MWLELGELADADLGPSGKPDMVPVPASNEVGDEALLQTRRSITAPALSLRSASPWFLDRAVRKCPGQRTQCRGGSPPYQEEVHRKCRCSPELQGYVAMLYTREVLHFSILCLGGRLFLCGTALSALSCRQIDPPQASSCSAVSSAPGHSSARQAVAHHLSPGLTQWGGLTKNPPFQSRACLNHWNVCLFFAKFQLSGP